MKTPKDEAGNMVEQEVLACNNLYDLYLLMKANERVGGPVQKTGPIVRHIFKLVNMEKDEEYLDNIQYYIGKIREMFDIDITTMQIVQKRLENNKIKKKLVWYPPGMLPDQL